MNRFRFGHLQEDADETADLIVPCNVKPKRWPYVCPQCSHLNPAKADECEVCGIDRPDDER